MLANPGTYTKRGDLYTHYPPETGADYQSFGLSPRHVASWMEGKFRALWGLPASTPSQRAYNQRMQQEHRQRIAAVNAGEAECEYQGERWG